MIYSSKQANKIFKKSHFTKKNSNFEKKKLIKNKGFYYLSAMKRFQKLSENL